MAKRDWKRAILVVALIGLCGAVAFWYWVRTPLSGLPGNPGNTGNTAAILEIPARPSIDSSSSGPTAEPAVLAMRDEVFDVAEQLVREIPLPDSLCLLGTVHHLYANDEVALRLWKQCSQIDPQFADAHHALGTWHLARGDLAAAESSLREAWRIDPEWDEIPLPLDKALQGQGKFRESIELLERFLSSHPSDADAWHRIGQAYHQIGEFEKARHSHQQAIDLRPQFTPAHHGLATALRKLGRVDEAGRHEQRFQDLMAADKRAEKLDRVDYGDQQRSRHRLVQTRLTAGRVYFKHGRHDAAQSQWRRIAEVEPTNRESQEGLCEVLTRQQRWDEALVVRSKLWELEPENTRQLLSLGSLQYKSGKLGDAEATFRRIISLSPRQPNGYAGLAQVQISPGRNAEEAVTMARKAVELAPTAAHHYILATAQWTRGDVKATQASLEEAIRLDPTEVVYREAFARLQMSQQK